MSTSIVAYEIKPSQHLRDDAFQKYGQRVFAVYDADALGPSPINASDAMHAVGLPNIGDPFSTSDESMGLFTLKCVSRLWHAIEGVHEYRVICGYESDQEFFDPEVSASFEQVDTWRSQLAPPNGIPSPYADIGGAQIDNAGVPVQRYRRRIQVALSKGYTLFPGGDDDPYGLKSLQIPLQSMQQLIGAVNEEPFYGFGPQTVMYLGANSRSARPRRLVLTHHFLIDENKHFIQFPLRDIDGRVYTGNYDGTTTHAIEVYWRATWSRIDSFSILDVGGEDM